MTNSKTDSASGVEHSIEYDGRDLEAMSECRNYRNWILDQFVSYLGKNVVEVGAGAGDFSKLLLREGIQSLVALEPAVNIYPILDRALAPIANASVIQAELRDVASSLDRRPDTITYINVLEHLSDDREELSRAFRFLLPGGFIWVFVPALQWLYGTNDELVGHFRRYERESLNELVENCGFRVVKSAYIDLLGIIPWFLLFRLLKQANIRRNQVSIYDRFCVPICRLLERTIRVPIGKNLVTVGWKPL
ncbi:MAG: class I SAM-dependent methyltransferase [Desulfomonilaceae bacterium]